MNKLEIFRLVETMMRMSFVESLTIACYKIARPAYKN